MAAAFEEQMNNASILSEKYFACPEQIKETFRADHARSNEMLDETLDNFTVISDAGLKQIKERLDVYNGEIKDMHVAFNKTVDNFKSTVGGERSQLMLKEELRTPPVAFSARMVADTSPAKNQVFLFQTVIQNTENGYDSSSGVFT